MSPDRGSWSKRAGGSCFASRDEFSEDYPRHKDGNGRPFDDLTSAGLLHMRQRGPTAHP
ncbi:hypothetical protein acdb102_38950 [Acidothermaceae bacterium B102]|nr:hypothetical protein acdb102_38950 [Acidothermaceae bacterium B102]